MRFYSSSTEAILIVATVCELGYSLIRVKTFTVKGRPHDRHVDDFDDLNTLVTPSWTDRFHWQLVEADKTIRKMPFIPIPKGKIPGIRITMPKPRRKNFATNNKRTPFFEPLLRNVSATPLEAIPPLATTRSAKKSSPAKRKTLKKLHSASSDEIPDHLPHPSLIFPVRKPQKKGKIPYPPVLPLMASGRFKRLPFGTKPVHRKRRFNTKEKASGTARRRSVLRPRHRRG
ncbi:unnamed protein product [Nippostrongylus brasiliensis]|uniref:TPX2_importin domain-containing protein n=1 Tax=Nippostrongylus brasiliensis TaxID=27835 RepID=A0A0N4XD77_NIPBR|nr:unnamed protein product [Nippostrongylus brasiliensis]